MLSPTRTTNPYSLIRLTITNLTLYSFHFSQLTLPLLHSLPLLLPLLSSLPLISAQGHQSPLLLFKRGCVPSPLSPLSLTAGARPSLTFVISNPAGSEHKKSVVKSLTTLIPPSLNSFFDGVFFPLHFGGKGRERHFTLITTQFYLSGSPLEIQNCGGFVCLAPRSRLSLFAPSTHIIYSHFLAIKRERCCGFLARSAMLHH